MPFLYVFWLGLRTFAYSRHTVVIVTVSLISVNRKLGFVQMINRSVRHLPFATFFAMLLKRPTGHVAGIFFSVFAALSISGCVVPPKPVANAPAAEDLVRQQRLERAQAHLADGLKRYDAGTYDESVRSFLLALDTGLLNPTQQITARKHMAFMHCVSGREAACKEEFEKAFALDAKFELTPAEAGHPTWGPVFRQLKTEIDIRKSGRSLQLPPKPLTAAEKLIVEATTAYDAADYNKAIKSYQDALKESVTDEDKIRATKFMAFSYCLSNRPSLCRAEFEKLLLLKPDFDLEPAEAGHPSWGPSFRTVKIKQKAAAAAAVSKSAPTTPPTPPKK